MRSMRASIVHSRRRRIAVAITVAAAATAIATPAFAGAAAVSTATTATAVDGEGFPVWYSDSAGTNITRCVEDELCLDGFQTGPQDETFYAVARAEVPLKSITPGASGGRARYRAVLEAAWASEERADGDQITFWRTQVTADKVDLTTYPSGTTIVFGTPYGNLSGRVTGDPRKGRFTGKLDRARLESTLGIPLDNFRGPLRGTAYGPQFLRWDTGRPSGHLGNPLILHTVTGASTGNKNAFQAISSTSRPGVASAAVEEFEVAGKCYRDDCK